jgi:nucleoside-diphosphate-sugar epimerase
MSRVVVTGAQGFIGQALVRRLLSQGLGGAPLRTLTLVDLGFDAAPSDPRVRQVCASLSAPGAISQALAEGADHIFHLASVPGGAAERDPELGRRVNLDATLDLIDACRHLPAAPRFVYASSVAVYGENLPAPMDEAAPACPALSYGAHKLVCELMVADASRRGWIQGCSLRLPGVVARPGESAGLMSAFMSLLFWRLAAGQPVVLPVSAQATCWWISVHTCVDNLVHAALVDASRLHASRSYQMPVLHLSVSQVVDALAARFGADRLGLVRYEPEAQVERLFGRYPPLFTPVAEGLGLRHDGNAQALVRRALEDGGAMAACAASGCAQAHAMSPST